MNEQQEAQEKVIVTDIPVQFVGEVIGLLMLMAIFELAVMPILRDGWIILEFLIMRALQ